MRRRRRIVVQFRTQSQGGQHFKELLLSSEMNSERVGSAGVRPAGNIKPTCPATADFNRVPMDIPALQPRLNRILSDITHRP
jgi:hypothetical protein